MPPRKRKPSCTELQRIVHVEDNNVWDQDMTKACSILMHASHGQHPFGTRFTRQVVGIGGDDHWDVQCMTAVSNAVSKFQRALTDMGFDTHGCPGYWDKDTDAAYFDARDTCQNY